LRNHAADKGDDANAIRRQLKERGAMPNIQLKVVF